MPGSRTTLPHTTLTLLLVSPLSCSPTEQDGQVSDPQGCRTVILPADVDSSTSTGAGPSGTSSSSSTGGTSSTSADATTSTSSTISGSTTDPEPICGNGTVEDGEECDDGVNDGMYDGCNDDCTLAPHCGDKVVQEGDEECDNDVNDGMYGGCNEDCTLAPHCGDGFVYPGGEECDDGNSEDFDGCTPACTTERIVFVSSGAYAGNTAGLNGLAGADSICQEVAELAGLASNNQTVMAWLSADGKGPATRFPTAVTNAKGPFLLPDDAHTKIADNWKDLTDGTLAHPIDIDETGATKIGSTVWTNTQPNGISSNKGDCSGWTTSANMASGGIGFTTESDINWTDVGEGNYCSNSARIYCFQVAP